MSLAIPRLCIVRRERRVDFAGSPRWRSGAEDDLAAEVLFDEDLVVVAGCQNPLARRRKINLTDLLDEPWMLPERDNAAGQLIAEGFRSIGVGPIKPQTISNSMAIRIGLVKTMGFLTILPGSTLHFYPDRRLLRTLRVRLPMKAQPVEIVWLKYRTPNPVAGTFLKCLRAFAKRLRK